MKHALIGFLGATLIALGASGIARSGYDDGPQGRSTSLKPASGRAAGQARYQSECGGCHLAYPPKLLPAAAWGRIMANLGNHFGDDAGLDQAIASDLLTYLQSEAADANPLRGPIARQADRAGDGPPRITQTRSFLRRHDEVPNRLAYDNPRVRSFSNCEACHGGAAQGRFDEDEVRIPGVGRWDD
jgi:mono/diheme cytochrome c family protein